MENNYKNNIHKNKVSNELDCLDQSNKNGQGWRIALISKNNRKIKYRIIGKGGGGLTESIYAMHICDIYFHIKCSCTFNILDSGCMQQ